ncbi:MAG: hypothetical protein KGP14_11245, partial [Betaproteobacteria bacterium]|nr:hypothetical protein [Betaproteobacteria bacterium]
AKEINGGLTASTADITSAIHNIGDPDLLLHQLHTMLCQLCVLKVLNAFRGPIDIALGTVF